MKLSFQYLLLTDCWYWLWRIGSSAGTGIFKPTASELLVAAHQLLVGMQTLSYGMSVLVPPPGLNPGPLHWELGVLAKGPPEKSS